MATNYFENLGFGQNLRQGMSDLAQVGYMKQAEAQKAQEQAKAEQKALLQFQNEQQKQRAAQGAGAFYNALNSNNPQAALQIAKQYEQDIATLGDPSFTVANIAEMLKTPEGTNQLKQMAAGTVQMAAGPQEFAKYVQAQQTPDATMTPYQQEALRLRERELQQQERQRQESLASRENAIQQEQQKADIGVKAATQKEERAQGVKDLATLTNQRKTAASQIATFDQLEKLSDNAFDGNFAGSKLFLGRLANQVGINVEGLSESEVFQAVTNDAVLGKSQQMAGALSNADMVFLQNAAPTLSQTSEGRKKLIQYGRKLAERELDFAKAAQKFRMDKGYFNMAEFMDQYDAEAKPLFEKEQKQATEKASASSQQQGQAPQAAIDYLMQNPQFKEQFKQKYGYLPEGM